MVRGAGRRVFRTWWSLWAALVVVGAGYAERPAIEWMGGGHGDVIDSVAISPDGQLVASGSEDWSVKLWRLSDGVLVRTLSAQGPVCSVAFSPDGQKIAAGTGHGQSGGDVVQVWSVADGALLRILTGAAHTPVYSVAFSPDGSILAAGADDGTIRLWRVADGVLVRTLQGSDYRVLSVSFAPDGDTLASAGGERNVKGCGACQMGRY